MIRNRGKMNRHEADRACQSRVRPRFADQPMVEGSPIKPLMLRPDRGQKMLRIEVNGRHPAQPDCDIRQPAMRARSGLVRDEAGRIDNDLAGIYLRLQNVRESFEGWKLRVLPGADVHPDRTDQFAVEV